MKTLQEVFEDWEAVIGLEIHTELTTLKTKMFCSCPIDFGAPPNTHVCPVCLGLPGALPVPNQAAIESIVLAGLATNCEIERNSMFYRKTYMYPDMPKNFQTTQGPVAFCMRGGLDLHIAGQGSDERIDVEHAADGSYSTHVGITRIHMEEDAGKMIHVGGTDGRIAGADHSLVDYNRAGTPLIELVTEPDLRTPEEARRFMQKLREIFLALGISDCSMEQGSMRCDGNISLRRRGATELGTKTELKNMNSFKTLHDGLAYEICRQAEVLEEGGVIYQETRHYEPATRRTIVMRTKETADDYRLFPEPDLAPYDLSEEFIERVRAKMPELPDAKRARFMDSFGLPEADADALAGDPELSSFFEQAAEASSHATRIANIMLNDLAAHLHDARIELSDAKLTPVGLAGLADCIEEGVISSRQGKDVLAEMLDSGKSASAIIEEKGMRQVSDAGELDAIVTRILADNPDKVAAYRGGKTGLSGFFVGQAMKATKGQGNPRLISELVKKHLEG